MMTMMTLIEVIVSRIMILVPLSRRHRNDSSEAHTGVILFGVDMQCIVILTCRRSLLSAAGMIKRSMQGTPPRDVLQRLVSAAGSKDLWHANTTMHSICTPIKLRTVCASGLPFLCLLDSSTTIIIIITIISIIVIIIIIIIMVIKHM